MRNRIAVILTAAALGGAALSGAQLSLSSGAVEPGKSVTLELKLNGGLDQTAALQCDLEYDFERFSITVDAGPAAKAAEKSVSVSQPAPNILRLLAMGFNRNTLSDGVVALVTVSAKSGAREDGIHTIAIARTVGSTKDAASIPFTSSDGQLRLGLRPKAQPAGGKQEDKRL